MPNFADLTLQLGLELSGPSEDPETVLRRKLQDRLASIAMEQAAFKAWCDRADNLYFTTTFTQWGADLWPDDPSASTPGRSHISINDPDVYVDIPASLQAVEPIENMVATEDTPEARHAAQATERVYKAWKVKEKIELKRHKAATLKELYGKTAGFVYYDKDEQRPCLDVIQNPRNLHIGFKADDYEEVEWAAYVTLNDPNALMEEYSIEFDARSLGDDTVVPWAVEPMALDPRPDLNFGPARVEVWDYWFRRPSKKRGKRGQETKMETWNVVVVGNMIALGPIKYPEYKGRIPYLPIRNTFIPGTPWGKPALWDLEQLIREKMTRITAGAQMIAGATSGDYWQMTGPDAPSSGKGLKPKRNDVVYPGAGNRIEAIQPFVAQFQLEQFLGRIDREMAVKSGLNDLLLGLAPLSSLSSSKAVNALIANYETRISMRRMLLYTWYRDTWELAFDVFAAKNSDIADIVKAGGGTLEIIDPSLSPRDEGETANRAAALVGAKLWSQARGMDAVGVDDPEQEQNIIREERTDATLWPADVQVMAQLMSALQSLGLQPPPGAQAQAQGQIASGQNDLRTALGAGAPVTDQGSQGPGQQAPLPPDAQSAGAPAPSGAPFAQAQQAAGGNTTQLQGLVQNGKAQGRILTKRRL